MEAKVPKELYPKEELTRSWVIYSSSRYEVSKIQKEVDKVFAAPYTFYPEIEWSLYGYRPPENYQVLGAWRNPNPRNKVFAFLLDNPRMLSAGPTYQLLLHIVGAADEIKMVEPKIEVLKEQYELEVKKESDDVSIKDRLDQLGTSKSLKVLSAILAIITAIINAFSLYLRQLPPPDLSESTLLEAYKVLLAIVNFSALVLLLIVIILATIFAIKYGVLLIRKI
jgi:hypothetical protein